MRDGAQWGIFMSLGYALKGGALTPFPFLLPPGFEVNSFTLPSAAPLSHVTPIGGLKDNSSLQVWLEFLQLGT